jgi:serine/threonine protein kinase
MLSSRFGATPRASITSLSLPLAHACDQEAAEETKVALTTSNVFSRRLTSYISASSAEDPNPNVDRNFRLPHLVSRRSRSTVAEVGEDAYSNDGKPSGDKYDRRHFKDIRGISRTALERLVLYLIDLKEELPFSSCRVMQRKEGSFHHAVFLMIEDSHQVTQEYVLKIPAHGTRGEWQINDNVALKSEAQLMQHIWHHTNCPVPEVIAYDGSLENTIGAPYILMRKMDGISAMDMWIGQPYKTTISTKVHLNADDPLPELEQKRITFLRSLARAMSELAPLEFKYTGMPAFFDPKDKLPSYIGPFWRWHTKTVMDKLASEGSFDTSEAFFTAGIDRVNSAERSSSGTHDVAKIGVWIVMRMVMSSAPFATTESSHSKQTQSEDVSNGVPIRETFVLRHVDLDLQNILVDEDGNVTGIVDWDGCAAVPHCLGYASMPTFLRRDWLPNYDISRLPHLSWSLDRYRELYAQAMEEVCKSSDAKYTRKSPMYQLVSAALDKDAEWIDVVEALLHDMPEFRRVDAHAFCRRLGHGWPAAEEVLKAKITKWLKPQ